MSDQTSSTSASKNVSASKNPKPKRGPRAAKTTAQVESAKTASTSPNSKTPANRTSEPQSVIGLGGETHQRASESQPRLTTNHGVVVSDNQNSLRLGHRGPTLLEDFVLREKVFHFDHERIPERIVHARGSGAHGYFECTEAIPELSAASLFQHVGEQVPVFARFSTVAGGAGSADTPRDVRGFAVKFYTQEGNWDLVGNNIPIFFIQDAIKFPDLVHAVKMEADRGYPQAASAHDTFWDFVGLMPESTHMLLWVMSDRTLPRSLRMMDGFGVHTFKLVDADDRSTFVKFHWRPPLGVQSTLWDEAVKIAGADPDFHRRDLHDAIEAGDFPTWDLAIQVFDEEFADAQPYDVLDATKLIPEEEIPLRVIGRMTLNRNPDNFFAETEQVAFLPTNIVPGIDFSDDPLLQGRLFSYLDTQHSRLGTTNFHQIPVNQPKCPFANFQRDGHMQTMVPTGRANYEPNSIGADASAIGPRESPRQGLRTHSTTDADPAKVRDRAQRFADHYSQATLFWASQTKPEQAHIASAFAFELSKLTLPHVVDRIIANLANVSAELASRVARALGIDVPAASIPASPPVTMPPSPALSILANARATLEGRKVGILITERSDAKALDSLRAAIEDAGATAITIAPRKTVSLHGRTVTADAQLAGSPSCLVDAVALLLDENSAAELTADAAAVQFVQDAFGHLKTIGATSASRRLLDRAGVKADGGVVSLDSGCDEFVEAAMRRHWDREPSVRPLA